MSEISFEGVAVKQIEIGSIRSPTGVGLPILTTTERDAISSPEEGKLIYNTTTNKLNFYNGTSWQAVTSA